MNFSIAKFAVKVRLFLIMLLLSFFTFTMSSYCGAPISTMEDALCNAYSIFNGEVGKAFAIFAIVALGVGFFLGKVSWGTAIAVALGIGALFGAPALVAKITGSDQPCGSTKGAPNTQRT